MKQVIMALVFFLLCLSGISRANTNMFQALAGHQGDSLQDGPGEGTVYHIAPDRDLVYYKPGQFHFISYAPTDLKLYGRKTIQKGNIMKMGIILSTTALLVAVDQPIIDESQRFGKRLHISGQTKNKAIFHVAGYPIYVPANFGSGLYYLGDGFTDIILTASFFGYGLVAGDNRALQTSSQLAEGLITVAVVIQTLKHVTGRQSPASSTQPGGKWTPFPNQVEYHKHVPRYDAYPSGHLATAMMVVTVIADNYQEHKYIKPLGYSLMTVLAFQMLNNGVHWASDYPLALSIGYSLGKIATSRNRVVQKNKSADTTDYPGRKATCRIGPALLGNRSLGIGIHWEL